MHLDLKNTLLLLAKLNRSFKRCFDNVENDSRIVEHHLKMMK